MNKTRIVIKMLDGGDWLIDIKTESLAMLEHIPSGRVYRLERRLSDLQTEEVFIRPYYRRTHDEVTTIFAVQTVPKEV